jgi:hypothetical protein
LLNILQTRQFYLKLALLAAGALCLKNFKNCLVIDRHFQMPFTVLLSWAK